MRQKPIALLTLILAVLVLSAGCQRENNIPVKAPETNSISETSQSDSALPSESKSASESASQSESSTNSEDTKTPTQPAQGNQTISTNSSVSVTDAGTILENRTIYGNLYIKQSVGSGNVYLKNLKVTGTIFVNGGGKDSVYLENVQSPLMVIDYDNHTVRVVAQGKTDVKKTTILTPAILKEDGLSGGSDGFEDVVTEPAHGYLYLPLQLDSVRLESCESNTRTYVQTTGNSSLGDTSESEKPPIQGSPNSDSSNSSSPSKTQLSSISAITGTPKVGVELLAGTLTPSGATAAYQWKISSDGINYTNIAGEITNKYSPVAGDIGKFIKVTATGTGSYSGTVTSAATTAVLQGDAQKLAADKTALTLPLGANSAINNITTALGALPSGPLTNGTTVTWVSDTVGVVSNDGQTVVRPAWNTTDATVVMTASLTNGTATDTKTFTLTVKKEVGTDSQKLAADKTALTLPLGANSAINNITTALGALPAGPLTNGTTVTWASDTVGVVSNDGQTVVRPAVNTLDATVVMTASLTNGTSTDTKIFILTVKKVSSNANLNLAPEIGTTLAGVVLTDDPTDETGGNEAQAILLSVTIPSSLAGNAVLVPVTDNATVKAYQSTDGNPQGDSAYLPISSYNCNMFSYIHIKVVSEDGSKILYYNLWVSIS